MSHTAVVILAAGNSSRMGRPKQLLEVEGRTLIRRVAETALSSVCDSVIVVLGFDAARIRRPLAGLRVSVVENAGWQNGMGTSIRAGVEAAQTAGADGIILVLGDQPLVSAAILNNLVLTNRAVNRPIVASQYSGTVGVPVYFAREYFADLLALRPDEGCKGLILKNPGDTFLLPCPEAEVDVDTPLDYQRVSEQLVKRDG